MLRDVNPVAHAVHLETLEEEDLLLRLPVETEDGKVELVHHKVGMVVAMCPYLDAHHEAVETEIKVGARRASYPDRAADVLAAVVAVVLRAGTDGRPFVRHLWGKEKKEEEERGGEKAKHQHLDRDRKTGRQEGKQERG